MLLNLNDKEVRVVGESRYAKKYKWIIVTCMAVFILGIGIIRAENKWNNYLVIAIAWSSLICLCAGTYFSCIGSWLAGRKFLKTERDKMDLEAVFSKTK